MKNIIFIFFLLFSGHIHLHSQVQKSPKLVVGIVVDQMREEYLYRFYNQYGENGFKRLMREGYNCRNIHFNYIPTVTGPGHTSIYAGSTPAYHGIVSNNWYDRKLNKEVYCVNDSTQKLVGTDKNATGSSPWRLLGTNLSDELKISTVGKARVIGVSLKDRAAILPAGHMADAAYWFDLTTGNFISSTFYMNKLPEWTERFNNEKHADEYLDSTWRLSGSGESYPFSMADDNVYEGKFSGKDKPVFPYDLKELSRLNLPVYSVLYCSAFGNSLLTDFAIETLKREKLGNDDIPDLLAISYSSTDVVGHMFGPLSKELNDTYLRLDMDIARLLNALDQLVGNGEYTLFITADHGVSESPQYLIDHRVPAGYLRTDSLRKAASMFLTQKFGEGNWIESMTGYQVYLNRDLLNSRGIELSYAQHQLADFLRDCEGISRVYTSTQLTQQNFTEYLSQLLQNGFYYKRSGDVLMISEPGWTDEMKSAVTHGTGYTYDTHVPLILYGKGIAKGESFERRSISDIAPTISMLLKIKLPSVCTGNPIAGAFVR